MENSLTKDIFWTGRPVVVLLFSFHMKKRCSRFLFVCFFLVSESLVFLLCPPSVVNGNLEKKIVNTGYEFVFKEYIFWELNKCHYSALLLKKIPPPVFNKRGPIFQPKKSKKKGQNAD